MKSVMGLTALSASQLLFQIFGLRSLQCKPAKITPTSDSASFHAVYVPIIWLHISFSLSPCPQRAFEFWRLGYHEVLTYAIDIDGLVFRFCPHSWNIKVVYVGLYGIWNPSCWVYTTHHVDDIPVGNPPRSLWPPMQRSTWCAAQKLQRLWFRMVPNGSEK